MFSLFEKKCPVCKMKLDKERNYPEGFGKTFCSEGCKDNYGKKMEKDKERGSDSCCSAGAPD